MKKLLSLFTIGMIALFGRASCQTVLIDFGASPATAPKYNSAAISNKYGAVLTLQNLTDTTGAKTGITLAAFVGPPDFAPPGFRAMTGFAAATAYTGEENGLAGSALIAFGATPFNIAGEAFVGADRTAGNGPVYNEAAIYFSGLNPSLPYKFTVFGGSAQSSNADVDYTFKGLKTSRVSLHAQNNNSDVAVATDIYSDALGKLVMTITRGQANRQKLHSTYLNALRIDIGPQGSPVVGANISAVPQVRVGRDRVKIMHGNVVTSDGAPLRGAPFFMDIFNTADMRVHEAVYREYFRSISRDYGMNCVRICPWIGSWDYDIKGNANHHSEFLYMLDKCVQWAAEDGIYAVIDLHTKFDTVVTPAKVKNFWDVVAPRYRDQTHVLFEAVNEPNVASALSSMEQIYSDLRALAPDTHIILWSLADPGVTKSDFSLQDLKNAKKIDYSNASFGFHIYDWQLNDTRRWKLAESYRDAGYPVICTEMMSFKDANDVPIYFPYLVENIKHAREFGMSWMQWAPRFNFASIDQYNPTGPYTLKHSDIAFSQLYKSQLLSAGINFWNPMPNGKSE